MEHFLQELKKITLRDSDRRAVRAALVLYVREYQPRTRGYFRTLLFQKRVFASALVLTLTGASVSYAAEGALPGDLLYTIKVTVNEEVRGTMAISPDAKAAWEARRAERRLEEAEKLVSEGKFGAETRATIEEGFAAHAERLENHISNSETDRGAEINSEFETSLRAHERILSTLAEKTKNKDDKRKEVDSILVKIRSQATSTATANINIEKKVSRKVDPEKKKATEEKLKTTEDRLAEVRSYIEERREDLGFRATAQAEKRLEEAENILHEGKTKAEQGAFGEAIIRFQRAQNIANGSRTLIDAQKKFKINLDFNNHIFDRRDVRKPNTPTPEHEEEGADDDEKDSDRKIDERDRKRQKMIEN